MGIFGKKRKFKKRDCPHMHIRDIYGDEINVANARSECRDCGKLFKYLGGKD
jgi:hypothetical protein